MSKAVRIRDHLYVEIERLAKAERRSIIGQLELLLEQALKMDGSLSEREDTAAASEPVSPRRGVVDNRSSRSESDTHFRPDFK